jgi:hypothetical protein
VDQEHFYTSPLIGLMTMNDIAIHVGVPLERVKAVIDKHRIAPARRVGVVRLWDAKGLREVKERLQ